ncbi:MAG: ABC transporter permease [Candidatus Theseobacter exili]|nr:ABC transporter permease [Candidatus Theseobacter exili]
MKYHNKICAFIKKGFLIEKRYKFHISFYIVRILIACALYYYLAGLISSADNPLLGKYSENYFVFILTGISFFTFLRTGVMIFTEETVRAMNLGLFEAMLATPTSYLTLIVLPSIWKYVFALFQTFLYLLFGIVFFHARFPDPNIIGTIIILLLMIMAFSGLGMISASIVIHIKKGDPVNWMLNQGAYLLGGVLFPITILPSWLRAISHILPITYGLNGIRHAIIDGWTLQKLLPDIGIMLLFIVILLPLGIFSLSLSIRRAKVTGTLAHY